jgi:tetratricopeptide (TPR) repeat protein
MKAVALVLAWVVASGGGAMAQQAQRDCAAADRALAQKQFEVARGLYEACLKAGNPGFETLSNLGMTYVQLGQFNEAIAAYEQALALKPDGSQLHVNLGLALLKTDRYDAAAREFAKALVYQPDDSRSEELLAFCHYQLKEYELAAAEAKRVRQVNAGQASAAFVEGSAYLKLHLYAQAVPLLDLAFRKIGASQTHLVIGEAYLGIKDYVDALNEFLEVEKLEPQMPGIHSHLGTAYFGLGKTQTAIAEHQKELDRNPGDFGAHSVLGHLKRLADGSDGAREETRCGCCGGLDADDYVSPAESENELRRLRRRLL